MDKWLIWCNLNSEQDELEKIFDGYCVSIRGSTNRLDKIKFEQEWRLGKTPILISKPSVFGWGMNWQHCNKVIFVGLSDSFEQYYQAVRRCWRFGQTQPVDVYIIISEREGQVLKNIKRKEKEFEEMLSGMIAETQDFVSKEIKSTERTIENYNPNIEMIIPKWLL